MTDTVTIDCWKGRFNIFDQSDVSWRMRVNTPVGKFVYFFDEEPNWTEEHGVEDAIGEVKHDLSNLMFHLRREQILETIEAIYGDLTRLEVIWARKQLPVLQRRAADAHKKMQRHFDTLRFLESELADQQREEAA